MARHDIYQAITDRVLAQLEAGVVAWRKPWSNSGLPTNLCSEKAYRGVNVFLLAFEPFPSRYWLTFNQAKALGGSVRKGERGTQIVYWKLREWVDQDTDETRRVPLLRSWTVFNAAQCDGIDAPDIRQTDQQPTELAAQVVADMPQRPHIEHHLVDAAFYRRSTDTVSLPPPTYFLTPEGYYATLFHELAHSTGAASRLARPDLLAAADYASDPYSREELVAEMATAMLCGVTGITAATFDNSASYIAGWLRRLKDDKHLLISAASLAQRAADFILGTPDETADESAPAAPARTL